jgi:hypothetical protein
MSTAMRRFPLPSCSCSDGNVFEAKGYVTWCPKRLQDEDHTYISGSMDERIMMSSRCLHEPQQKKLDIFEFSEAL